MMRLREVNREKELADRESLRIKAGDEIIYEGAKYIATQVGSKVVHMYRATDPQQRNAVAFLRQVHKAIPIPEDMSHALPGIEQKK